MGLGPLEIALIVLAILLLFGYKKLPDASRSLGRSMRIFKGEMKGMKDDDVRTKAEAETVRGQLPPTSPTVPGQDPVVASPPATAEGQQHKPYPEYETPR
jgi:sec-independent protein translocase protein TatA